MKLCQEIIFLEYHCKTKYVVENVIPYYEPMFNPKKRGRHLYWTNFNLPNELRKRKGNGLVLGSKLGSLGKYHDYNFTKYKGKQRTLKIARNLVDYEAGKTIFETMLGIAKKENINQEELF